MSLANILKQNTNRVDGFFRNLKVDSIDIDLGCIAPEITLSELRLKSETDFITTLTTRATQNYQIKLPLSGAFENSLLTINENGELNFLPSSSLPTIGGDIVCNSLQSATFVNTDLLSGNNLILSRTLTGGQVAIRCQNTDNSFDEITLPNTTNPQQPLADMCLTIKSSSGLSGSGYNIDTIWKLPRKAPFIQGTPFSLAINNPELIYLTKQTQFLVATSTFNSLGFVAGKSYRLLIDKIDITKRSGGSNQSIFVVEVLSQANDNAVAICGMGNGTNDTNYKLINQKVIGDFVNTGNANNAYAYTKPIELIFTNVLIGDILEIKIGNGYFNTNGWDGWQMSSNIEGIWFEI